MDNELFDEQRKCPNCKVVTYCDNCPVCGKRLPRSSRAMWKMTHKHDVAGEEGISNDLKHERFEERILETMHGNKKTSERVQEKAHTEPIVGFDQKNVRQSRKDLDERYSMADQGTRNTTAKIIAIIVVVIVAIGLVGYTAGTKIRQVFDNIDSIVPTSNSSEIISDYVEFDRFEEQSIISLTNTGGNVYYGDIIFYNEEHIAIASREDLAIFPYETFDLEVYTNETIFSFEIDKTMLQSLQTKAPTFSYTTFNDYGYLQVYLEEDIGITDLEILVLHMYEASSVDRVEEIYDVEIMVDGELFYDCYIDDYSGTVSVYPSENAIFIQDIYDFDLAGNTLYKGITKDVHL